MSVDLSIPTSSKRDQAKGEKAILELLHRLGGGQVSDDDLVFEGKRFVIPETMTLRSAKKYLERRIEQDEEVTSFSRTFDFRPWDGAFCMQEALKKGFGTSGIATATMTMFGPNPPELIEIRVDVGKTVQVPWGRIQFPMLEAEIYTGAENNRDKGPLFKMTVNAPRKHAAKVQGLFKLVQNELETGSIYRGKAFDGAVEPSFVNPFTVDPRKVVYTDSVMTQFKANVWSLIEDTHIHEEMGLPLKRAVLLAGPYGVGKTLGAMLTAQRAAAGGWTFIQCRPGRDDLNVVLQTAKLYQPAVVFYEDVDTIASTGDQDQVTKLLDMFDGITQKGTKLLMVLTTNSIEKIHRGMLRPGRLDAIIEIAALDVAAKEQLIRASVPEGMLDANVNFAEIDDAMEGFLPAFIKESIDRAQRYAIARTGGRPSVLTTEDFVEAAKGLRPQFDAMSEASEGHLPDTLKLAFQKVVGQVIDSTKLVDDEGDPTVGEVAVGLGVHEDK